MKLSVGATFTTAFISPPADNVNGECVRVLPFGKCVDDNGAKFGTFTSGLVDR